MRIHLSNDALFTINLSFNYFDHQIIIDVVSITTYKFLVSKYYNYVKGDSHESYYNRR